MHNLYKELGIESERDKFGIVYDGAEFGECCKLVGSAVGEKYTGGEIQANPDRMEIVTIQDEIVVGYVGPSETGGYIGLIRK